MKKNRSQNPKSLLIISGKSLRVKASAQKSLVPYNFVETKLISKMKLFRSRIQKQKTKEKPKMTAKEELEEALQDNEDLKSVHEDMIQRLNEKHLTNEIKIRSQCLGHDRFHRRYVT